MSELFVSQWGCVHVRISSGEKLFNAVDVAQIFGFQGPKCALWSIFGKDIEWLTADEAQYLSGFRPTKKSDEEKQAALSWLLHCDEFYAEEDASKALPKKVDMTTYAHHLHKMGAKRAGRNNLYKWFREHGYVQGTRPLKKYMDEGLFEEKAATVWKGDHKCSERITLITPLGQQVFQTILLQEFAR